MATVQYTVQYSTVSHRHFFMYSYIPCVTAITNYLSFKMAIEAQGYPRVPSRARPKFGNKEEGREGGFLPEADKISFDGPFQYFQYYS